MTFSTGEMVPEFEEAAAKLDEGKITTEPVKSEYGYHIIKMVKKPEKGSLKEERKTIEDQLLQEKLADSAGIQEILSTIMQDANVVINDEDLSTAMDGYLKSSDTSSSTTESKASDSKATDSSTADSESSEK